MIVPHELLNAQVLNSMIEDFVTRHGAIHGHADVSLEQMIKTVRDQLAYGSAQIVYDEQEQSWTIITKNA